MRAARSEAAAPYYILVSAYLAWTLLFVLGRIRDFFRDLLGRGNEQEGYVPIRQSYEDFFTRRVYYRLHDCWNRPIGSAPSSWVDVLIRTPVNRQEALQLTGERRKCMNLGSYNYLGFASSDEYCTPRVQDTLKDYGWSTCSSRIGVGTTTKHIELEKLVAEFLGVEAAITFGMGFATNSATIPALVGKGCLVLSDALNHSSIVAGVRASGAKVKVFKHNDMKHLEQVLRRCIAEGQERTRRRWKKVVIIVEGIYSMEGDICKLKEVVALKKKYKAYLYLDEAHSIGAIGAHGRGVMEYCGVDPKDVDIAMGTFTKSFGSCGGYIGGSKELINYLRRSSPAHLYAASMSPPVVVQTISALQLIMGKAGGGRGLEKVRNLRENANYFRKKLIDLGLEVLGDWDSPVMPVMIYGPGKVSAFSRMCLEESLAVVVVGFPATKLLHSRMRACISASHTKEDLDFAIEVIEDVAGSMFIQHGPIAVPKRHKHASATQQLVKSTT